MSYIDPSFAHIDDKELAVAYTHWLYSDPNSNPSSWDKPELWKTGPKVKFIKRVINMSILNAGADLTITRQLFGGKNAVVFNRQATVKLTTAPAFPNPPLRIPNEHSSYVTYQQVSDDGQNNVEEPTIEHVFGTIPGQPFTLDPPQLWWGNAEKTYTLGNDFGADITANLVWTAAILDTAR